MDESVANAVCTNPGCDRPVEMGRNGYPMQKCRHCYYRRATPGTQRPVKIGEHARRVCGHPRIEDEEECSWCRR